MNEASHRNTTPGDSGQSRSEAERPAQMEFTGERYVPSLRGQIKYEHLHRYAIATQLVAGKDVLDMACGEGYGTNLLANAAASVVGVDNSPDAIRFAARKYIRSNVSFVVGACESVPLPSQSIDVVVSFETIEHLNQHDEMLREVRRVLRPGGLLVISTPDRMQYSDEPKYNNPFHLKELYSQDFESLLKRYFAYVHTYGQRLAAASFVQTVEDQQEEKWTGYTGDADRLVPAPGKLNSPLYLIAICSDDQSRVQVPAANSVYLDPADDLLKDMSREWSQHFNRLEANIGDKAQVIANLGQQCEALERTAQHQKGALADLNNTIANLHRELDAVRGVLSAVYSSRGWRALQLYYRLRERVFPSNSRRRGIVRSLLILRVGDIKRRIRLRRDSRLIHASGLFDREWYLQQYEDVAQAGVDPVRHYLERGAFEGRNPGPLFDSQWYMQTYADVARANANPLVHFLNHGRAEGRSPHRYHRVNPPPESFLPVPDITEPASSTYPVDVIIPVYKGFAETKACIESVLSSTCKTSCRVVVVNDKSPEPELTEFLRALASARKITLIENSKNMGFVQSVNKGMKAGDRDVVLLNSDTVVFDGWIDRLRQCAYADERCGTATPFSNNATICSYPIFCADNKLPSSLDLSALDSLFASINSRRSVEIPTAVGFCMFIRRKCLEETGFFDANAFGVGYGEENDFCMRAAAKGWKHKLACDVFVYHAGAVSFGDGSALQRKAMQVLVSKHPQYPSVVAQHVELNPANAYRIAVTAQRIRNSGKHVCLSVSHIAGGGVAQHVTGLSELTADRVIWIALRPSPGDRCVVLECLHDGYQFSVNLDSRKEYEHLVTILRACGVARIHVQHLMGHVLDFPRLLDDLAIPFDFTVHDYYTICPQVTLSDMHGKYCGEPERSGCDNCLALRPREGEVVDISSWRAKYMWALSRADRVIAPSVDAAQRIKRYYPEARIITAEHPNAPAKAPVKPRRIEDNQKLRIAVLGTMAVHKGLRLLEECAGISKQMQCPLEFILVGSIEEGQAESGSIAFSQTGQYKAAELPGVLDSVAPHVVWFPGQCAETYSYTLSTCLQLGLPVAVHDIGAFPERVGGRPWTWIQPLGSSASEWVEFFVRIREQNFVAGNEPAVSPERPRALPNFYPEQYLQNPPIRTASPAPRSSKQLRVAAAVSTDEQGQIQACGYVRVLQPLTHPAIRERVGLSIMPSRQLATAEADVILVQRMAVRDIEVADHLINACRARGLQLVYEIDDDLFQMGKDHPEHEHYANVLAAAELLVKSADVVLTPTEVLRQRLLIYNANTIVLPNYLDERLWTEPSAPRSFSFDQVRVLYAGTISHLHDLEFLGRAVEKIKHRDRLHFEIVGVNNYAPLHKWFQQTPVPPRIAASYPRFVTWLQNQNRWHWAVAPLQETQFNRSKSPLKFLEYSALGLPSLCSDGAVYTPAVRHGETGLLVPNDPERWREALEQAVTDSALWGRLRNKCGTVVSANTISANADKITSVWTHIAKGLSRNEETQEVGA